ncbi:glycosyltransferase family 4 protein [Mycobacterium sp. URHB0044]|uniref:glycosyltransferase family 4 protein n=1 Tax=Mycobacterium sp. URHB0044 TaxID=1380386 RepID=UPI000684703E|nr:glycosyltransferase family 4 protein [Mycobacterium sp. URHB0044]
MTTRPVQVLVLDQARGVWGAQRYLLRLAPLLRERGIELTLAGPRSLELHQAWLDAGFDAVHLDAPIERSIRDSGRPGVAGIAREARNGLQAARRIARLAQDGGYDVLWANGHWTHLDTAVAGRLSRTPVVLHLHEEAMPGLGRGLRSAAVLAASRTVAVSRAVAVGLPSFAAHRVDVIPNGIDTQAMSPTSEAYARRIRDDLGVAADELLVLAATRLDPSKRIEDLVSCVAGLKDRRIRLVIAGSTSGYPDYERRVREQGAALGEAVRFCGNRDDMAALFGASDVVVHAGIVEGMPLTLIEAQACGTPVVAYDVAGVAEAVVHGTTGLLVPPCDVAGLRDSLRRLADSAALRAAFGEAARAHVLTQHCIETQAERNAAVLANLCGRPQPVSSASAVVAKGDG